MFFCDSSNAKLPEKVFAALFNGNCATVEGEPAMTPEATCRSLVRKLFSSCPSDTNPDRVTITFTAALPVSQMFNCGVSITINPPGAASSTHESAIGQASYKYLCLDQHPMPISIFDWGSYASLDPNMECPVPCSVEPLKPITDPDAIRFENGDTVRTDRLSANTQRNLQCLRNAILLEKSPGSITVTSAWRPQAYQDHLKEIVDKISQINSRDNKKILACAPIRSSLEAERSRHGLGTLVGRTSNHTAGNAFDASWSGITNARIDVLAGQCGLTRPFPGNDPVHFQ